MQCECGIAKKLWHFKSDYVNILVGHHALQEERMQMGQEIQALSQYVMTLACFVLNYKIHCPMHPMFNLINDDNILDKDLHMAWEKEHC